VFLRKTLAPTAAGVVLLAVAFALAPVAPAAAQEVVQDEGQAYRAWHEASQAADNAKALAAAKAYIAQYPTGQYGDFLKKWLGTAQMTALDAAIKEKRTADMIAVGREILAADPENLNVVYAMASQVRVEMLGRPPVFDNAAAGVEFAQKGIAMVEGGKTLAGVATFDKNATLAWMTQVLALSAQKNGNNPEAIGLFDKSTAYAPADPAIAGQNLLRVVALRNASYAEAAKAYNALPEADRAAAEPPPAAKAAKDALNAQADGLINSAASFVALGRSKNLPAATVDRVNQALEAAYKVRFPEDATLDGLKKILADKARRLSNRLQFVISTALTLSGSGVAAGDVADCARGRGHEGEDLLVRRLDRRRRHARRHLPLPVDLDLDDPLLEHVAGERLADLGPDGLVDGQHRAAVAPLRRLLQEDRGQRGARDLGALHLRVDDHTVGSICGGERGGARRERGESQDRKKSASQGETSK
jgi:hypothetical protein